MEKLTHGFSEVIDVDFSTYLISLKTSQFRSSILKLIDEFTFHFLMLTFDCSPLDIWILIGYFPRLRPLATCTRSSLIKLAFWEFRFQFGVVTGCKLWPPIGFVDFLRVHIQVQYSSFCIVLHFVGGAQPKYLAVSRSLTIMKIAKIIGIFVVVYEAAFRLLSHKLHPSYFIFFWSFSSSPYFIYAGVNQDVDF